MAEPQVRHVSVFGRSFRLRLVRFSNGCFLAVSEGVEERMGGLVVAVKLGDRAESTTVIPVRYGQVFSTMLADMAATLLNGTVVLSLYVKSEPDAEAAKGLIREVRELLTQR